MPTLSEDALSRIRVFLRKSKAASIAEISAVVSLSESDTRAALIELERQGMVRIMHRGGRHAIAVARQSLLYQQKY